MNIQVPVISSSNTCEPYIIKANSFERENFDLEFIIYDQENDHRGAGEEYNCVWVNSYRDASSITRPYCIPCVRAYRMEPVDTLICYEEHISIRNRQQVLDLQHNNELYCTDCGINLYSLMIKKYCKYCG